MPQSPLCPPPPSHHDAASAYTMYMHLDCCALWDSLKIWLICWLTDPATIGCPYFAAPQGCQTWGGWGGGPYPLKGLSSPHQSLSSPIPKKLTPPWTNRFPPWPKIFCVLCAKILHYWKVFSEIKPYLQVMVLIVLLINPILDGGAYMPPHQQIPLFHRFCCRNIFWDLMTFTICLSPITVCLQKTRLVYLFWLNFGGRFLDEKSDF